VVRVWPHVRNMLNSTRHSSEALDTPGGIWMQRLVMGPKLEIVELTSKLQELESN